MDMISHPWQKRKDQKGEMQVRKAAARAVIWVCDYMIGYHGRLIEQALISIAVSTAMAAFMIGLVVLTL